MSQEAIRARITTKLLRIYGEERAETIIETLFNLLDDASLTVPEQTDLTEEDAILITYGDQVRRDDEVPLATLHDFANETLKGTLNTIHLLPFYPYSSDDGFSVIDYYAVNPTMGDWSQVKAMSVDFQLMFDAVFNHISVQSDWFQAFLKQEAPYNDYFVTIEPNTDLSDVVRPRALPLLTPFETTDGEKLVWTTFSADQVDLNYESPALFLDMIRVLLYYIEQGARFIRLDAIAFLWKVPGTPSIHLEETHLIIQIMRDIMELVAPYVILITETNVPHEENISYFGDGTNEAQMVYNFALPPLVLHTLTTGNAQKLSQWASELERVGAKTAYFNFTASHDGIGMRPATGILSQQEIDDLVERTQANGGLVSYRSQSDGTQIPYELNIAYFDAINSPELTENTPDVAVNRFIVSQAMAMALVGVPGIYFHSLFGSRNWREGVEETGHNRTINRQKLDADDLLETLNDKTSLRAQVYRTYRKMIKIRTAEPAFHPIGEQEVLTLAPELFSVKRTSPDGEHQVIAIHNISDKAIMIDVPVEGSIWTDIISEIDYTSLENTIQLVLEPYQVAWLKAQ